MQTTGNGEFELQFDFGSTNVLPQRWESTAMQEPEQWFNDPEWLNLSVRAGSTVIAGDPVTIFVESNTAHWE